jgi:hypothetical protein
LKRARKQADEYEAFSRKARRWLHWRPGERAAIKRRVNRRERHDARKEIRNDVLDLVVESLPPAAQESSRDRAYP